MNMIQKKSYLNKPNICIFGDYGKGNLGDEALLKSIMLNIKEKFPQYKLVVISSNAQNVIRDHNVYSFSRKPSQFFKKIVYIKNSAVFIIGGGTLIRDSQKTIDEIKIVITTFFWPFFAKIFGVPIFAYGQGVGPANNSFIKFSLKYLMAHLDALSFRDKVSYDIFKNIVGLKDNYNLTIDPVVSSDYFEKSRITKLVNKDVIEQITSSIPYVLVALRFSMDENSEKSIDFINQVSLAINKLVKEINTNIILLPIQISATHKDDIAINKSLEKKLETGNDKIVKLIKWQNIEEATCWLQNSSLIISDRLHALLLGAKAEVPVVGLSHETKIFGCLEMIGINNSCNYINKANFNIDEALSVFVEAFHSTKEDKSDNQQGIENWKRNQPANIDILKSLIKKVHHKKNKFA